MALACREYLQANGVEVRMSRVIDENDTLEEEIRECNAYAPTLAVDVHNNAGGGDGFEVFHSVKNDGSRELAQAIEKEVLAIGQNSRGLKTKWNSSHTADYFGFIRSVNCKSIIVEGVFVDNRADASQADTLEEQQAFGVAYAKGILKYLGINSNNVPVHQEPTKPVSNVVTGYTVTVKTDVLNIREGAGTNYRIVGTVKRNEVFTIVEECNGFGRLKSGAGWISLAYTSRGTAITPTATYTPRYVLGRYKVNCSALNVRAGAGTGYAVKKVYKNGTVFDTFEIKNNWAHTPSGWVCLDYCTLMYKY